MVIFFEWHQSAMEQKRAMPGEDTGLGALASPLVGYLGKVQERASSLDNCPWCCSKGLTFALRSYRINLQESITLCTNPTCLFPLVSRSLEDVLSSLQPPEPAAGNKRKNTSDLEEEDSPIEPVLKRLRSSETDGPVKQSTTEALIGNLAEHCAASAVVNNGQHAATKTEGENVKGYHEDSIALSPQKCATDMDISKAEDNLKKPFEPVDRPSNSDSNQSIFPSEEIDALEINPAEMGQKSPTAEVQACKENVASEIEGEEFEPVPDRLFWRNDSNLCWLDSLLVALVNCKSLLKCRPKEEPRRSSVWKLLGEYEHICAAVRLHQQTGREGIGRVPHRVLQKTNADLHSLRMSIFKLLQPKLHCNLGQKETPVFAMPVLLKMDSWTEPLFQTTFRWEFKCSHCQIITKERVVKTLPTLTNLLPDWRPLHAVHTAPCNACRDKDQRRTMTLESLPPVFGLHFVEGLPDGDVTLYTFTFKRKRYSVTTVIQYDLLLKHFVTWIRHSDGSWLEYDDLKHPDCRSHQSLPVPAQEMHVVFWEEDSAGEPRICSPDRTFSQSPPSQNDTKLSLTNGDVKMEEPDVCAADQSVLISPNDTDIINALTPFQDGSLMDTTVTGGADTSIGSTTLQDAFEGLGHDDIVTLTLVELDVDSEPKPPTENKQPRDSIVQSKEETLVPTPDSSSARVEPSNCPDVKLPATSTAPDSGGVSSIDPAVKPGASGGRRSARGINKGRQACKKAASSSKAAPQTPPLETPKPSDLTSNQPSPVLAQTVVQASPQVSPESSTDASQRVSANQKRPTTPLTLDQNARWSFLLSKHPLHQACASIPKLNVPAAVPKKEKPARPAHSTPNPVRRIPERVFPKLKTDESDGLPLKAAEMYGAFGAKAANTLTPPSSPALVPLVGQPIKPVKSGQQKSLAHTTLLPGTTLLLPEVKEVHQEITSCKKHSGSKVPPGLSHTEALRYKLKRKLKAKKRELDKLNSMLGLQPDSTGLGSPNTVTSSTYEGSACPDDFLSDLLSPAPTTASSLSPDSTDFLEMIAHGQDAGKRPQPVTAASLASLADVRAKEPENFLDDFFSEAMVQRPTDAQEADDAFSALESFFV